MKIQLLREYDAKIRTGSALPCAWQGRRGFFVCQNLVRAGIGINMPIIYRGRTVACKALLCSEHMQLLTKQGIEKRKLSFVIDPDGKGGLFRVSSQIRLWFDLFERDPAEREPTYEDYFPRRQPPEPPKPKVSVRDFFERRTKEDQQ